MHIHILGICGTFMGGLALIARELGHSVSGSDAHVYPPMSVQLETAGIRLREGYAPDHLQPAPDLVVVGNALSRGNPAIEHMLDSGLPYTSGPQWLADHVLRDRWVLAVAGTHGKTTTSSLLAHLLDQAGLEPGFLIGGVPENFGVSARIGKPPFFVIEADEYDTAFFDKRSKFVHYRPRTLILNNLEYDHADIFPDLKAIQRQFQHLLRTVPATGLIVRPLSSPALDAVVAGGCWTPCETFGEEPEADWSVQPRQADYGEFEIRHRGELLGRGTWPLIGRHNALNAAAALAAARHAGVPLGGSLEALPRFRSVKRRLERIGLARGVAVYDDFAHHPTAIQETLQALRQRIGGSRLLAVFEPRSNSMRLGVYRDTLAGAFREADAVLLLEPPGLGWDLKAAVAPLGTKVQIFPSTAAIIDRLGELCRPGDHVLVMSNGGFEGLQRRLLAALDESATPAAPHTERRADTPSSVQPPRAEAQGEPHD